MPERSFVAARRLVWATAERGGEDELGLLHPRPERRFAEGLRRGPSCHSRRRVLDDEVHELAGDDDRLPRLAAVQIGPTRAPEARASATSSSSSIDAGT